MCLITRFVHVTSACGRPTCSCDICPSSSSACRKLKQASHGQRNCEGGESQAPVSTPTLEIGSGQGDAKPHTREESRQRTPYSWVLPPGEAADNRQAEEDTKECVCGVPIRATVQSRHNQNPRRIHQGYRRGCPCDPLPTCGAAGTATCRLTGRRQRGGRTQRPRNKEKRARTAKQAVMKQPSDVSYPLKGILA